MTEKNIIHVCALYDTSAAYVHTNIWRIKHKCIIYSRDQGHGIVSTNPKPRAIVYLHIKTLRRVPITRILISRENCVLRNVFVVWRSSRLHSPCFVKYVSKCITLGAHDVILKD